LGKRMPVENNDVVILIMSILYLFSPIVFSWLFPSSFAPVFHFLSAL
jgi:hypothetical protein